MPFYYRYRRRPRRLWRRRARKAFFRRRWRTRRYRRRNWVRNRKRKLKKLYIQQWQPKTIKKLKITGDIPLFECTSERLGNNLTQYLESHTRHNYPGGGSFSLNLFTLQALYELHGKARNWWTQSNCKLPLIRYTGCKIKLFRSISADYIFAYTTCGKLEANLELYQSCQPSILKLNKHKRIVTCKEKNNHRKPYTTLKIKPPPLWTNKWYFQKEVSKLPLLLTLTSAASLDRYYISAQAQSNTMGFKSLDTKYFQYHDFKSPPGTSGYIPNDQHLLFTIHPVPITGKIDKAKYKDLIYLANTNDYTPGTPISGVPASVGDWSTRVTKWQTDKTYWGNPFYSEYINQDRAPILITNKTMADIVSKAKQNDGNTELGTDFALKTEPIIIECRYNPEADKSHNAIFFSLITDTHKKWQEPDEERLICKGLPIWYMLHGFVDYHAKAVDIQRLYTDWVLAIISDAIEPKRDYYVPLDYFFLNGRSPYETQDGQITIYDRFNWHPKVNFQVSTISKLVGTGPATVKLPDNISTEAHLAYTFYFKLGGCPPPMDEVCDPAKSPDFPTPSNIIPPTLLQDPETPIQYYLSSFDERRGLLTERAAKRLKTDWFTTESLFKTPGKSTLDLPGPPKETSSDEETPSEEKDPQTLQLRLQHHRRKQRKLQQRILELLALMDT
nr:MAG: ORF1 [TTV-like mini virus]UGV34690.1 MAG: ORF1 [TTV-like mini virus]UGV34702.1 MAG: ORF1 [TTV-like mini virus]UGV34750.1 MAG: ORF1 [TTV-like mini virus]